jgi:hypothetical protein
MDSLAGEMIDCLLTTRCGGAPFGVLDIWVGLD